MPLKVLIAPDKFKGTLTAQQAAEAIARGWRQARPADTLQLLPITDGGDGFGEVLGQLASAEVRSVETVDAARRRVTSTWWWKPESKSAVLESARTIGLALLPPGRFHPFELDTLGLGALLQAAATVGAQRCVIGIGGSATNDAGLGLARALGWQFLNKRDEVIQRWTELHSLSHLHPPQTALGFDELVVAVDVQNPLLGPAGCTRIYGPQKGLRPEDFEFAERCLAQLAQVVERQLGLAVAAEPGTGAAGGLGFGLRCFAGARLEPGFAIFARQAQLAERVSDAQLVLTGEGAIDDSTLMGKGVGELARICKQVRVPCLGFAGKLNLSASAENPFAGLHSLTPEFTSVENALAEPALWLERLAERAGSRCPV
jgi:glycerate kinase